MPITLKVDVQANNFTARIKSGAWRAIDENKNRKSR